MSRTRHTTPTPPSEPLQTDPAPTPPEARWHDAEEMRWAARHWATRMGVKLVRVQLRQMRTKWASISTAGRLTLNTDLLRIPKPLGEFVIVHELVHLLAPNHGKVFKAFMHAYLPDWQTRERELRRHADKATTQAVSGKSENRHRHTPTPPPP